MAMSGAARAAYAGVMRAVLLEVPEEMLADRRRRGADVRDEMWEGVLHMVPQPGTLHMGFSRDLLFALGPLIKQRGLEVFYETSLFGRQDDYRIPDLTVVAPAHVSKRGIEGKAALVIEILSPGDESRDKLPWYARMGVEEAWLVEPHSRAVELYRRWGDALRPVEPTEGVLRSTALGVELRVVPGPGPRLELAWDGDVVLV
jgi:Uma2 family endonuclease